MSTVPRALTAAFILAVLICVSYLPAILGHISVNPLYRYSGLASQTAAGPSRGLTVIDPNAGTTTQALGHLSAEDWLHGQVPWWNPYSGVGLPLAAEMQSESLFFPFVLLLHFSTGVIWLKIALQVLAGTATFLLLRQLALGELAAFLGGVFYAFNGTFSWFGHGEIMPLAFLPLFLFGIERALHSAKQGTRGGWVMIAIALAYSIYSGFPETAFIDGLLALLWALVRLVSVPADSRKGFAAKICIGGCAGLLLSAPIMLPFFEYLQHSAVAHNDFGHRGLPSSSFLQLFLPYIFGPIEAFNSGDPSNELIRNWGNIGGYFGISVVFLALLALVAPGRERGLRILLGMWTFILVARSISVPGTEALFHLIPGMNLIAIYRNSSGSFEMATAILAAFAIDQWQRGHGMGFRFVAISSAITALLVAIGFCYANGMIHRLHADTPGYSVWVLSSVAAAALALLLSIGLCLCAPTRLRSALLAAVIIAEVAGLYLTPTLAGLRGRIVMDTAPLAFLRDHLGWQRAYALGAIHPNYGAYYGLPFVDHESLPVSDSWMGFVHQNLDADADAVTFSGEVPPPMARRTEMLRHNLAGFEAAGVQYVVAPRGSDPLEVRTTLPHVPNGNIPIFLSDAQQISGTLPPPAEQLAKVQTATVSVGTENNTSNGILKMQLCSGADCAEAQADLTTAADNAPLPMYFDHAIALTPRQPLRYTLTHSDSSHPVAIWMFPAIPNGGQATLPGGEIAPKTPEVTFVNSASQGVLKPVFQDATVDIFELPHPAPYFETTSGKCKLSIESRERVRTSCAQPTELVRRELSYPGWHALVNGHEQQLTVSSIFQTTGLPAGEAVVEFKYVPTHLSLANIAALAGVALVAASLSKRLFV